MESLGLVMLDSPSSRICKKYSVVGIDINQQRIDELKRGNDQTNEIESLNLRAAIEDGLSLTTQIQDAKDCTTYIVTVPTPVTSNKQPDLQMVIDATKAVATVLKKGDTVVYESTVYPGVTEEVCVPILKENTTLNYNTDFFVGYSPERINPGDKKHSHQNNQSCWVPHQEY